jgi:fatty acid desaturase
MIYIIGLILSFIYCGQLLSSEIQSRNTFHMKNGDKPNAFVTIFPAIPFFQIIFLIICWLLNYFFPSNCDQSFMYLIYLPIYFLGYQF